LWTHRARKSSPCRREDSFTEEKSGEVSAGVPVPEVVGYVPIADQTYHELNAPRSSLPGSPPGVLLYTVVSVLRTISCVL
jgi:hypothetical protein